MLRVWLLGGVDLRLGEQQVPPLDSARAESLLAYLLLHRDAPQQRQHLAFTLWPDSTESQARTNLRHVLHTLRRALPEADRYIDAGQRTIHWRPDARLWLDVAAFEEAVEERRLEDAVETYRGALLEGNYDEWLLEERERLAQLYRGALERLASQLAEGGRPGEAIGYAERLLRQDPLREDTFRLLIRLYNAAGDPARALRTYHACATTLVRELGVEPSAATRREYEALLSAAPEPATAEAPGSPARPRLVGRAAERARLAQLWRATERGRPQFVLITGEAGIGKSRLSEELRSWCEQRGAVTVETRSYPAAAQMAYGTVAALLRAEQIRSGLGQLERAHLTEIARLLPDVLSQMPGLVAPEQLPADEQRQRLFAAAVSAIRTVGEPLLLIVEDIHWCDSESLRFLHHLLRHDPRARLVVGATARREELAADHPLRELIADLQSVDVLAEVPLDRLGPEETAVLAEEISGRSLGTGEAERLYEDSEGVPLFVVEALRAGPEAPSVARGEMSERVRAVISARLARLSKPAAELVGVAATIGREFTTEILAEASGLTDEALVDGLDEMWRREIVRARGPSSYEFSHGNLREAAYEALSPAVAGHHHLRIARALQRSKPEELDALSGQIAAHYEAAGAIEDTIAWLLRAADVSQRLYASADAVRLLERALGLVEALPAGAERDTFELRVLTMLPTPLLALEGYLSGHVGKVHARAQELAGTLGVDLEAPLIRSLALASLARGDFEAGRRFGGQLYERGEREGDDVLRVEGGYVLGIAAYWQGRLAAARSHFEDTIGRCRSEQRSAHLVSYGQDPEIVCLTRLAHTYWLLGEDKEAERVRELGLEFADDRDHPYSRAVAHVFAGLLALDQRDEERLCRHADELASADAFRAPQIRIVADLFAALLDVLRYRSGEGAGQVQRIVRDARRDEPPTPGFHALVMRILLEACAAAGEAEAGLAAADEALEIQGGTELWGAEIRRLRAEFLGGLGAEAPEVEAELRRAIELARHQGARPFEQRAWATLDRVGAGTP